MGRGTLFSVSRSWGGEEGKRKKEKKKVKITEGRRKDKKKPVGAEESPGSACSAPFRGKMGSSFSPMFFTREESGKEGRSSSTRK